MKKTGLLITLTILTLAFQAQSGPWIINSGGRIISSSPGSYWVVSGGDFTLISRSATDLASMDNLLITSGASLTIDSQSYLTVTGAVTDNNSAGTVGLTINSDATGTASLITPSATGAGSTAAQLHMTTGTWHLVSSPVLQSVTDFLTASSTIATNGASRGMMDYDPAANSWKTFFTNSSAGNLGSGKGYCERVGPGDANITATGPLQAGLYSVAATPGYWDCIGNPFTSTIGITSQSSAADNFLTLNSANFDPSYGAIYVWATGNDTYNGQYGNYTIVNNVPTVGFDDLPQGQAFLVKRKAVGGAAFSFTNSMQLHNGALVLKAAKTLWPTIKLHVAANSQTASSLIVFNEAMTKGLDPMYDAGLLKGASELSVYTRLVEDNGVAFAIQALPLNDFTNMIVPVGVDSKAGGDVVFSAETANLPSDCKVILEDKVKKTFTDLSANVYKATLVPNSKVADRFQLHTSSATIAAIGKDNQIGQLNAYAIPTEGIRIVGDVSAKAVATLYDVVGKVVLSRKLSEGSLNVIPTSSVGSGLYILSVEDQGKAEGFKMRIMN